MIFDPIHKCEQSWKALHFQKLDDFRVLIAIDFGKDDSRIGEFIRQIFEWLACGLADLAPRGKHLQKDHRCGIYYTRPQICRDYSTDNCEFDEDAVYEMYFETAEQVADYTEARYHCTGDSIRSPEPELLPLL